MRSLDETAARIRTAIETECFREAQNLLDEYAAGVEAVWQELTPEQRRASRLPQEALSLVQWAHQAVSVARIHSSRHLDRLTGALAYYDRDEHRQSWQTEV
ncbi:MAG: hypothetical protein HYR60_19195 [Acidobacteria bacterium]|nr:hypothetical protein [Acidobacteriota bacterium]MBI3472004.1 hypothetical protein [Candidatus Solibacter usitatus]